ncbi:conserved unknown protein [Ectocarpus siliculosus]|uniref:Uncharacterized protein n=1 Tax=Ectocarpus siliculosus TaxID=2880 RepID=D8LIN5_ECTSI|nr:conserved unknown protein [Ectocarpus siliculosus]|eukprot:CBN75945.1 conserved unknown protein [Ectocarpus siliculosus]
MGNQGSFMEKVYVYLPVLMCHSKMDYSDKSTLWNIRAAYFAEQIGLFAFTAYFVFAIRRRRDHRKILVPDITQGQVLANNVPGPDELMYRKTTYFQHEMTEVFQQLQQQFVALMLTILAHFVLGFRPILLLQIFSAPYHFSENRLLRKLVLGLKPGYRVWGERFEGELEGDKVKKEEEAAPTAVADGEGAGDIPALDSSSAVATSATVKAEADPAVAIAAAVAGGDDGSNSLPMPRELEDKLIDAWEAAGEGDFGAVMEQLGPFTVNTRTPALGWSPLMVACGLSQVGEGDIKAMVEDLDAQVDLQDQDGWTCLHWAAQQGRVDAARVIFEALGSIASEPTAAATMIQDLLAMRDAEGKTAADVARGAGLASSDLEEFLGVLEDGAR